MRSVIVTLVLVAFTVSSHGQGPPWERGELKPKEGAERGPGSEWNPDQQALLESLAEKFDVDPAKLRGFKEEKLGWGEIIIGLEMTKVVEESNLDEIMGKRKAGSKWEEIAAGYEIELKDVIGEHDALEVITEENTPMSQLMAEAYEFPEEKLIEWKGDDLTWGELQIALAAAKRAEKPVEEILELFRSGWGWGDIAKSNGFLPAEIMNEAGNPLKKKHGKDY